MGSVTVDSAEYRASSDQISNLPKVNGVEIAFIGRSNAGKSTLINKVTGKRGLAHASATPGKTRAVNIFEIKLSFAGHRRRELYLADLPGYGFAKLSKRDRERLNYLSLDYISNREGLVAVVLVCDCRRKPDRDDLAARDIVAERGAYPLIVATKSDTLNQSEKHAALKEMARGFSLEVGDLFVSSQDEFRCRTQFWERVVPLFGE